MAIAVAIRHCDLVSMLLTFINHRLPQWQNSWKNSLKAVQNNFCGDFNIHMDQKNCLMIDFSHLLDSASADLYQHIDFPTHPHGHILDLLLTTQDSNLVSDIKSRD